MKTLLQDVARVGALHSCPLVRVPITASLMVKIKTRSLHSLKFLTASCCGLLAAQASPVFFVVQSFCSQTTPFNSSLHLCLADLQLVRSLLDPKTTNSAQGPPRSGCNRDHSVLRRLPTGLFECFRWCLQPFVHSSGQHTTMLEVVCCQSTTGPLRSWNTQGLLQWP